MSQEQFYSQEQCARRNDVIARVAQHMRDRMLCQEIDKVVGFCFGVSALHDGIECRDGGVMNARDEMMAIQPWDADERRIGFGLASVTSEIRRGTDHALQQTLEMVRDSDSMPTRAAIESFYRAACRTATMGA